MASFDLKLNEDVINNLAQQAVERYAHEHRNECANCGKPVTPSPDLKADEMMLCADCAKKLKAQSS